VRSLHDAFPFPVTHILICVVFLMIELDRVHPRVSSHRPCCVILPFYTTATTQTIRPKVPLCPPPNEKNARDQCTYMCRSVVRLHGFHCGFGLRSPRMEGFAGVYLIRNRAFFPSPQLHTVFPLCPQSLRLILVRQLKVAFLCPTGLSPGRVEAPASLPRFFVTLESWISD